MNFTGSTKIAQTINGSIPGPLLRWREGDTVTLRVANRLVTRTPRSTGTASILPADMDGVPGLSFHGIRPRRDLHLSHSRCKQSGTYWYHSHSGFQEQRGVYGPLVIEPRGAGSDRVRSRARHPAVGLDRREPERVFSEAEEAVRLLQLPQAHARRFLQGRSQAGLRRDAGRSRGVGRDAHEPHRSRRRRRRHLHALDERRDAERQLDRASSRPASASGCASSTARR